MRRLITLVLLALLAAPAASQGDDSPPLPRKHVLSGGVGVTLGGLGARYTYRMHERGPAISAGAGVLGYAVELGVPFHRAQSKPSRELFVYAGVLRWQILSDLGRLGRPIDRDKQNEEGSHIWVIGIGPRLWPDRDNRAYVAGGVEWMLSNENGRWVSFALEGGVGF